MTLAVQFQHSRRIVNTTLEIINYLIRKYLVIVKIGPTLVFDSAKEQPRKAVYRSIQDKELEENIREKVLSTVEF